MFLTTKKAQKRLGKSGVRTHDPNLNEIYLIKMTFSNPILSQSTQEHADELYILIFFETPSFRGISLVFPIFY